MHQPVYIKNNTIRTKTISDLYASARQCQKSGLSIDRDRNGTFTIASSFINETGAFGLVLESERIQIFFNNCDNTMSIWEKRFITTDNDTNDGYIVFHGSQDDVKVVLGKMIGQTEADNVFLSLML